MALDTHQAVTRLTDTGSSEPHALAVVDVVDVVEDATSDLVTKPILEAALYKALLAQSGIMFGLMVGIAAACLGIAHWMFG